MDLLDRVKAQVSQGESAPMLTGADVNSFAAGAFYKRLSMLRKAMLARALDTPPSFLVLLLDSGSGASRARTCGTDDSSPGVMLRTPAREPPSDLSFPVDGCDL